MVHSCCAKLNLPKTKGNYPEKTKPGTWASPLFSCLPPAPGGHKCRWGHGMAGACSRQVKALNYQAVVQATSLCTGSFFRKGSVTIWGPRAGDASCAGIKPRELEGRKEVIWNSKIYQTQTAQFYILKFRGNGGIRREEHSWGYVDNQNLIRGTAPSPPPLAV